MLAVGLPRGQEGRLQFYGTGCKQLVLIYLIAGFRIDLEQVIGHIHLVYCIGFACRGQTHSPLACVLPDKLVLLVRDVPLQKHQHCQTGVSALVPVGGNIVLRELHKRSRLFIPWRIFLANSTQYIFAVLLVVTEDMFLDAYILNLHVCLVLLYKLLCLHADAVYPQRILNNRVLAQPLLHGQQLFHRLLAAQLGSVGCSQRIGYLTALCCHKFQQQYIRQRRRLRAVLQLERIGILMYGDYGVICTNRSNAEAYE